MDDDLPAARQHRERDLLPHLPLLPWARATGTTDMEAGLRARVWRRTNETVKAFAALALGEVRHDRRSQPSWEEATQKEKEFTLSVWGTCCEWAELCGHSKQKSEAMRLLGFTGASYGGHWETQQEGQDGRLNKGAVCPINVEQLSLPPPGTIPVELASVSPTAAAYLENFSRTMLRRSDAVDWEALEQQKVFTDEVLKRKKDLVRLCERMLAGGMLGTTDKNMAEVSAFGVVKGYHDSGELKIRAVWDERRANLLWEQPPFIPLGSPATLCHVDLSDLEDTGRVYSAVGDIPDWFYRLRLPSAMWSWFVIGGLSTKEFRKHLAKKGIKDDLGKGEFLAVTVLVMGWSWAPFLAHSALTDLLDDIHNDRPEHSAARRLVYGRPAPQLFDGAGRAEGPVEWAYIDDYGSLFAPSGPEVDATEVEKEAARWGKETREGFLARGLPVHKEFTGHGIEGVLGSCVTGRPYKISLPRERMVRLVLATEAAIDLPVIGCKPLERLIGLWAWALLVRRQAFSILGVIYHFMRKIDGKPASPWDPEARAELAALSLMAPWLSTCLETPWLVDVFATDASMEGFGVVQTKASKEEIVSEARFAEMRGWMVAADDVYNDHEEAEFDEDAENLAEDTFERGLAARPSPPIARRVFRVAHLFSGHRREGDLECWLSRLAASSDMQIEVWSLDVAVDPTLDLSNPEVVKKLAEAFKAGFFHAALAGPPCSTWSIARWNRSRPGPRPLRTRAEPWGRTDVNLAPEEKRRLQLGSFLLKAVLELFSALVSSGGVFMLEHPADPGSAPYPSIWALPEIADLTTKSKAERAHLDQCRFGRPYRKSTFILTNARSSLDGLRLRCNHAAHGELQGQNPDGTFRTQEAQTYTTELCEAIATIIFNELNRMNDTRTGPDADNALPSQHRRSFPPALSGRSPTRRRAGERIRAPALATTWATVARWRLTYKGLWQHREHIGLQEMRTVSGLFRHLARSRSNWNKRILILTDSMATLGAIGKGRSSVPSFLRHTRMIAAISLGFGMLPYLRYIPSELNPADGPSRGVRVGAAEKTVQEHAGRLAASLEGPLGRSSPIVGDVAALLAQARACSGYAGG